MIEKKDFWKHVSSIKVKTVEVATKMYQYNQMDYQNQIEQVLIENPATDGVFASSDVIAAQVLQICQKLDKKVPEQVKVIGFDDVYISKLTIPQITSIHQPLDQMAKEAVEVLLQALNGKLKQSQYVFPVHLVKRQTT